MGNEKEILRASPKAQLNLTLYNSIQLESLLYICVYFNSLDNFTLYSLHFPLPSCSARHLRYDVHELAVFKLVETSSTTSQVLRGKVVTHEGMNPNKKHTLQGEHLVLRFVSSIFEKKSVPRKQEPIGSIKFRKLSISILGYFGSASVLTELTKIFYRKLR